MASCVLFCVSFITISNSTALAGPATQTAARRSSMRRKSFTKDGSGSSASRSDNTAGAWIEQYDEQAGSSYYSNSVTGATSWTRPTEMDNLSLSSASATGDHNQIQPFRLQLVLHACEKMLTRILKHKKAL